VLVREPRSTVFVPLTTRRVIPVGSTIDTTRGKLALLAAWGAPGSMQSGTFDGGAFTVTQDPFALTNLLLVGERPRATTRSIADRRGRGRGDLHDRARRETR
jgi:hypothetical protein